MGRPGARAGTGLAVPSAYALPEGIRAFLVGAVLLTKSGSSDRCPLCFARLRPILRIPGWRRTACARDVYRQRHGLAVRVGKCKAPGPAPEWAVWRIGQVPGREVKRQLCESSVGHARNGEDRRYDELDRRTPGWPTLPYVVWAKSLRKPGEKDRAVCPIGDGHPRRKGSRQWWDSHDGSNVVERGAGANRGPRARFRPPVQQGEWVAGGKRARVARHPGRQFDGDSRRLARSAVVSVVQCGRDDRLCELARLCRRLAHVYVLSQAARRGALDRGSRSCYHESQQGNNCRAGEKACVLHFSS